MPPVVIGATIAGAAALGSAAIASSGAKKAAEQQSQTAQQQISAQEAAAREEQRRIDEAVQRKITATQNIKYPTYLSGPAAQEYQQTLRDRMAGKGLIDVNAQTSPIAAQIRAGFREQTKPAIEAGASARGLGRSTIPVSQIGQASQAAERDIASRMAELELTRQQQIERAVTGYGALTEQEQGSQERKAEFERGGEFSIADTQIGAAQAASDNQFAIAESIRAKGAAEAAAQLQQQLAWAQGLLGAGGAVSSAMQTDQLIRAIENQEKKRTSPSEAAKVAVSGGGTFSTVKPATRSILYV